MKSCFFKYFNKYLIQTIPITKEVTTPRRKVDRLAIIKSMVPFLISCQKTAPHTTGADKKKENLAALSRSSFKIRAAVIVVPLLENPGIKANT